MSTHDMNIANSSGAAVRSDLNSALQALASTSKDLSRPSTVFDGQLQIYTATTPWTLDIYDGSDYISALHVDATNNIAYPYAAMGKEHTAFIINNTSDADHDIDFEATTFLTNTNLWCRLPSTITKRIDAPWAAGSGNGGLDTGSVANATTYHCYLIRKTSDGSVDAIFSMGTSGPTVMPSGYAGHSRRGSVKTDASANIIPFKRAGTKFYWSGTMYDVSLVATPNGSVLYAMRVPDGVVTKFMGTMHIAAPTAYTYVSLRPYPTASDSGVALYCNTSSYAATYFECLTDTSSQIELWGENRSCTSFMVTGFGYDDFQLLAGV